MAEGRRLYIGNLPFELLNGGTISEKVLEGFFDKYGEITDVVLMREPQSKRLRGFGFVEYATAEQATAALDANQADFHGRTLTVQLASPRRNGGQNRSHHENRGAVDR